MAKCVVCGEGKAVVCGFYCSMACAGADWACSGGYWPEYRLEDGEYVRIGPPLRVLRHELRRPEWHRKVYGAGHSSST